MKSCKRSTVALFSSERLDDARFRSGNEQGVDTSPPVVERQSALSALGGEFDEFADHGRVSLAAGES